jgi:hypothetical protein
MLEKQDLSFRTSQARLRVKGNDVIVIEGYTWI